MKRVLIELLVLTATGQFDAWSTNRYINGWRVLGSPAYEVNPLYRPVAGKAAMYAVVPALDLVVYGVLRKTRHKRLATAWAYGVSASHVYCTAWNVKKAPPAGGDPWVGLQPWRGFSAPPAPSGKIGAVEIPRQIE